MRNLSLEIGVDQMRDHEMTADATTECYYRSHFPGGMSAMMTTICGCESNKLQQAVFWRNLTTMSNKKPNADDVKEEDLTPDDLLLKLFTLGRLPMAPDELPTMAVRSHKPGGVIVKPYSRKLVTRVQKKNSNPVRRRPQSPASA